MIGFLTSRLRALAADETGTATVPFALWTPVFIAIMVSGVELGAVSARHTALESGMDRAVREIRLGTGTVYDHASVKSAICDYAGILPHCGDSLMVEMIRLNVRNWQQPPQDFACVDAAEPVAPVTRFEYGRDNELMLLRACYKYEPVSPVVGLGSLLRKDANGHTALISQAAFVQEPM